MSWLCSDKQDISTPPIPCHLSNVTLVTIHTHTLPRELAVNAAGLVRSLHGSSTARPLPRLAFLIRQYAEAEAEAGLRSIHDTAAEMQSKLFNFLLLLQMCHYGVPNAFYVTKSSESLCVPT